MLTHMQLILRIPDQHITSTDNKRSPSIEPLTLLNINTFRHKTYKLALAFSFQRCLLQFLSSPHGLPLARTFSRLHLGAHNIKALKCLTVPPPKVPFIPPPHTTTQLHPFNYFSTSASSLLHSVPAFAFTTLAVSLTNDGNSEIQSSKVNQISFAQDPKNTNSVGIGIVWLLLHVC